MRFIDRRFDVLLIRLFMRDLRLCVFDPLLLPRLFVPLVCGVLRGVEVIGGEHLVLPVLVHLLDVAPPLCYCLTVFDPGLLVNSRVACCSCR